MVVHKRRRNVSATFDRKHDAVYQSRHDASPYFMTRVKRQACAVSDQKRTTVCALRMNGVNSRRLAYAAFSVLNTMPNFGPPQECLVLSRMACAQPSTSEIVPFQPRTNI